MGINGKHKLTHSLDNLSFADVCAIAKQIKEQNDPNNQRRVTVDVDASWMVRMKNKMHEKERVGHLIRFCKVWSDEAGFDVFLICDGEDRHHTKRVRYQRIGTDSRSKLRIRNNRRKLHSITKASAARDITVEEKSNLLKQFVALNDEQNKLEQSIDDTFDVGNIFYNAIIQKLVREKFTNGSIKVLQAEYQADSVLAYRMNHGLSDIMICADSDQAALCGCKCFAIKQFKFEENKKNRDSKVSNMSIFTTSANNIDKIKSYVPNDSKCIRKISNTPVFEDISNPKLRALIAVGLGCDVFPKGIPNLGLVKMNQLLIDATTDDYLTVASYYDVVKHKLIHLYLAEVLAEKQKQTELRETTGDEEIGTIVQDDHELTYYDVDELFEIFVESFSFEPANYLEPNASPQKETMYIYDNVPESLHPYNMDFARNAIGIKPRDFQYQLVRCPGPCTGHSHPFLISEGVKICSNNECKTKMCESCIFEHKKKKYCYTCYTNLLCFGPSDVQQIDKTKSVADMLLALQDIGVTMSTRDDDILSIEDAYDTLVVNGRTFSSSIKFPTKPSQYLTQDMKKVSDFNFTDGGNIIFREEHKIEQVVSLLELFESLLVSNEEAINNDNTYGSDVLPTIISTFAEGARDHGTGHRLKHRCLRHGMDTRTPELAYASGSVIEYNGHCGLYIKHKVQASMKQDVYECEVAFTKEAIIANTCTCMCGCQAHDQQQVLCVHILPILYQIHMLLHDGLAMHILYEMSAYNKTTNALKEYNETNVHHLIPIIRQLEMASLQYKPEDDLLDLERTLLKYDVGTEKVKFAPTIQERDKEFMGPLKNLDLSSLAARARRRKHIGQQQQEETENDSGEANQEEELLTSTNGVPITEPIIYKDMVRYGNAFLQCLEISNTVMKYNVDDAKSIQRMHETAGFKLLLHRSGEQLSEKIRLPIKYKNRVEELIKKANSENRTLYKNANNEQSTSILTGDEAAAPPSSEDDPPTPAPTEYVCVQRYQRKRKYCCVKDCKTSYKDENVTFYKVPLTQMKVKLTSSDEYRRNYYYNKFRRKKYIERFGKSYNDNAKKELNYCHKHEMDIQNFTFPWYDRKGKKRLSNEPFVVPEKQNDVQQQQQQQQQQHELTNTVPMAPRCPLQNITNTINNNVCQLNRTPTPSTTKPHLGRKCDYVGCENRRSNNITLQIVPFQPSKQPKGIGSRLDDSILKQTVGVVFRQENLKRMKLNPISEQEIRICCCHEMETIQKQVEWVDRRGICCRTKVEMNVPCRNNFIQSSSRGRQRIRPQTNTPTGTATSEHEIANVLCKLAGCTTETVDQMDQLSQDYIKVATNNIMSVANNAKKYPANKLWYRYNVDDSVPVGQQFNLERKKWRKPSKTMSTKVVVRLDDPQINMTVGKLTSFRSVHHMLVTLCTFCTDENDDLKTIEQTTSRLTWFEEWLVFFTIIKGKLSWSLAEEYFRVSMRTLRRIFDLKMQIMIGAREHWPTYATLREDEALRKEKWNEIFENERVVMWDNTDIKMYVPSDASNQRITYSRYYAGNVGKGAVFIQPCGWMGTHDIWCGGVSDTEYFIKSGIIQQQNKFVDEYDSETKDVPWTNVLDRGYRVRHNCWKEGKQRVLQPSFANNQRKFSGKETIHTSQVASDRSGNERAVNVAKRAGYIKRGLVENESVSRLSNAWLVWSFVCNFIYLPVH